MNIILIIFDTLRKDCIGAYGQPPWGAVQTPHLDAFASQSLVLTRAYPESLPTLPARRALYTGQRVFPFREGDIRLKGDFVGAAGWGPIPEQQDTLAELLRQNGYRTALISDVYHMFKPSKNFWRGFDQWTFLRGQEEDPYRSGPQPSQETIRRYLPEMMAMDRTKQAFMRQSLMNLYDRRKEEDYFGARVLREAAHWLEENQDAEKFFLTVESFDPHEPWWAPEHYRRMYSTRSDPTLVLSGYHDTRQLPREALLDAQAGYSALVTFCDRWFGYLMESMRVLGLLDKTLIIVTSDHGHSLGEGHYLGKRGYPSRPEVYDVPLMIRLPDGRGAGTRSESLVQHTDISAEILHSAGIPTTQTLHGQPFIEAIRQGKPPVRDHVTIGWGSAVTVIKDNWWLNIKVNGKGAFLHNLEEQNPWDKNYADENHELVRRLFTIAQADAGGEFPDWLVQLAEKDRDAPGCSALAARD